MELGRRLGLDIDGVGLPGHFVVRVNSISEKGELVDVFEGGEPLSDEAAKVMILTANGGRFDAEFLEGLLYAAKVAHAVINDVNHREFSSPFRCVEESSAGMTQLNSRSSQLKKSPVERASIVRRSDQRKHRQFADARVAGNRHCGCLR